MRATPPILITTAKLTSSTVAEPYAPDEWDGIGSPLRAYALGEIVKVAADYSVYESLTALNAGNTPKSSPLSWRKIGVMEQLYDDGAASPTRFYALGETVYSATAHRVYESLQALNAGNPLPVLPETETPYWQDVGPTMKYAMFDLSRNTKTVGPSPLTVVAAPGERMNTIGLTGMTGNELLVKVTSVAAGGIIYPVAYSPTKTYNKGDCMTVGLTTCYKSKVDGNVGHAAPDAAYWDVVGGAIFDLNTRQVFDATTYYFEPFSTRPSLAIFNIPLVSDPVITVTLTASAGNCKIGGLTLGTNIYLGELLKPASNKGLSFSSVTRDLYGATTLVKRKMLRKISGTLRLESYRIDKILETREELDAEPALYTGTEEDGDWTGAMTIVGVHQQFDIGTADGDEALIPFSAEEI